MKNDPTPKVGDVVNIHVSTPLNDPAIAAFRFSDSDFAPKITDSIDAGADEKHENHHAMRMFEMYCMSDMLLCSRKWFYGVAQILNERLEKIEQNEAVFNAIPEAHKILSDNGPVEDTDIVCVARMLVAARNPKNKDRIWEMQRGSMMDAQLRAVRNRITELLSQIP